MRANVAFMRVVRLPNPFETKTAVKNLIFAVTRKRVVLRLTRRYSTLKLHQRDGMRCPKNNSQYTNRQKISIFLYIMSSAKPRILCSQTITVYCITFHILLNTRYKCLRFSKRRNPAMPPNRTLSRIVSSKGKV